MPPSSPFRRRKTHPHRRLIRASRTGNIPRPTLAELDLLLVLAERAATAAAGADSIGAQAAGDLVGLADAGVLDGSEHEVAAAEEGEGDAGAVESRVRDHVGRVLSVRTLREAVLCASVDDARTPYPRAADADVTAVPQAVPPCSTCYLLVGMLGLAREMVVEECVAAGVDGRESARWEARAAAGVAL